MTPRKLTPLIALSLALAGTFPAHAAKTPATAKPAITEKNASLSLSTGPRSEEERLVLWKQSREFIEQRSWAEADARLERLLFRYPEHPQRLEALTLRGAVLLKLGRLSDAIGVLHEAWQSGENEPRWALPAGELLARADVRAAKWTDAVLLAQELKYRAARNPLQGTAAAISRRAAAASWLIEAQARLGQKKAARADGLLRTYRTESSRAKPAEKHEGLEAEADSLTLEVQRRQCAAKFDRTFASEAAALGALDQAFLCESERMAATLREFDSTNPAAKPVPAPLPFAFPTETEWLETTLHGTGETLAALAAFCRSPRAAAPENAKTPEEKSRFRAELADETVERCREKSANLLRLVGHSTEFRTRLGALVETSFSSLGAPRVANEPSSKAGKGQPHP